MATTPAAPDDLGLPVPGRAIPGGCGYYGGRAYVVCEEPAFRMLMDAQSEIERRTGDLEARLVEAREDAAAARDLDRHLCSTGTYALRNEVWRLHGEVEAYRDAEGGLGGWFTRHRARLAYAGAVVGTMAIGAGVVLGADASVDTATWGSFIAGGIVFDVLSGLLAFSE